MGKDTEKPTLDVDKLPLKQKALAILTGNGLSTNEAGEALNYKGNSVYDAKTKLNKNNLSNRKLGSMAFKAVKETLKMKPVLTNEFKVCYECKDKEPKRFNCVICNGKGVLQQEMWPSHGNRLEAAKMYYDRTDPVVNVNQNLNVNVNISPVDLDKYRNKCKDG